jgi:hypothetical protein
VKLRSTEFEQDDDGDGGSYDEGKQKAGDGVEHAGDVLPAVGGAYAATFLSSTGSDDSFSTFDFEGGDLEDTTFRP